jgi:urea ABC transporter permease protein UrtC
MKRNISKIELTIAVVIAVILVIVMPALNAASVVSNFTINLWGKYLCYGLLAISVDLLWGYTGLLSLGQALFFSLGGYMLGMHLMLMIGPDGQYYKSGNNPHMLPDFMIFLGHTFLPSFWRPFMSFGFAALMVVVLPALLSLVFGFLAFRKRIKGVYFSILTQALTYGAALMFFQNNMTMGGNNGFTDFKRILGADMRNPATQRALYIGTAVLLVVVYAFCRWLTRTKFGLVQRAVRDSEVRVLFSGYAAANYKLFVFVASAVIASLGGAFYVTQVGIINPSEMWPDKSLEAVVWCAVGGRGTIVGPIIGAISVNALKSWATTGKTADYWLIILGVLFIIVVLLMPKGIFGLPSQIRGWFRSRKSAAPPEPAALPTGVKP